MRLLKLTSQKPISISLPGTLATEVTIKRTFDGMVIDPKKNVSRLICWWLMLGAKFR
jgi:hypothetical protein